MATTTTTSTITLTVSKAEARLMANLLEIHMKNFDIQGNPRLTNIALELLGETTTPICPNCKNWAHNPVEYTRFDVTTILCSENCATDYFTRSAN